VKELSSSCEYFWYSSHLAIPRSSLSLRANLSSQLPQALPSSHSPAQKPFRLLTSHFFSSGASLNVLAKLPVSKSWSSKLKVGAVQYPCTELPEPLCNMSLIAPVLPPELGSGGRGLLRSRTTIGN